MKIEHRRGSLEVPRQYALRYGVVVVDCPLGITRGTANGWRSECGVADAEHAELGGQPIQIQADPVEVRVGGAPRECGSDRILCRGVLRDGLRKRAVGRRQKAVGSRHYAVGSTQ